MPHYQVHFGWSAAEPPPAPYQLESSCPEEAAKTIKATAGRNVNIVSVTLVTPRQKHVMKTADDLSGTTREHDAHDHPD